MTARRPLAQTGLSARTRQKLASFGAIVALSTALGAGYGAAQSLGGSGGLWIGALQGMLSGLLISFWCGGADIFVMSHPRLRGVRALPFLGFVAVRAAVYGVGILIGLRAPEWLFATVDAPVAPFGDPRFLRLFAASLAVATAIAFWVEISRLLGPGVMTSLITGRYHRPRREDRVFLFADIEGSTALAERIGDLEFHRFLAAVFGDWAEPVGAARGETHRYVGDEIIVTWPLRRGITQARCLACVFAMRAALEARAGWYHAQFGIVPKFRAALHCGSVVTGEMGDQRKEIVFLGDTVNTTSRMQAACRDFDVGLILSGALADRLPRDPWFRLRALGAWTPRGKSHEVRLFTADPS
jgi:adenylate cyclase